MEGQPATSAELPHVVAHDSVTGSYFEAMGIPLKAGRYLGPQDASQSERVVVVNETLLERFSQGQNSFGPAHRVGSQNNHGPWMRIVGIVADVKQGPLNTETFPRTVRLRRRSAMRWSRTAYREDYAP